MEEWNSIPKDMVQNLCRAYLERVKKVVEIEGGRIEPEYFKKKRYEFCKTIIEKELKPEQIFFTDESKVELGSFTNDMIRLNPEKKNLMKKQKSH